MEHLKITDLSDPTRSATACCLAGPALFTNVMSRAINPSPMAAERDMYSILIGMHVGVKTSLALRMCALNNLIFSYVYYFCLCQFYDPGNIVSWIMVSRTQRVATRAP